MINAQLIKVKTLIIFYHFISTCSSAREGFIQIAKRWLRTNSGVPACDTEVLGLRNNSKCNNSASYFL